MRHLNFPKKHYININITIWKKDMSTTSLQTMTSTTPEYGLSAYLRQIRRYPFLSEAEEKELTIRACEHQDREAARTLVTSHLRLVVKIAFKMRKYGLAILDLISEGNIGLMYAITKFKPSLGYRLSTYAMWWIKASIQEFIIKSWSLVKMGTTVAQKKLFFNLNKLKNKIRKFSGETTIALSENEIESIATTLDVSKNDVKSMEMRLEKGDTSLDLTFTNANGDTSESRGNLLPSLMENQEVMLAESEESENKKKLLVEALSFLNPREKDIIMSRRLKTTADTLETLSMKYKVSRERIRQIEGRALERLQEYCLTASKRYC